MIGFYRSIMRLLVVVLTAVILFSVLIGCKGNGPGKDYFPPVYEPDHTEPSESGCNFIPSNPDGSSLLWGISPYTFLVAISVDPYSTHDKQGQPSIPVVEVDFSDGTGWHDYSTETREFYEYERAWEDMPTYTLIEPGAYPIHVSVTLPDGDVLDNEDFLESNPEWQTITVLPADDGGGA